MKFVDMKNNPNNPPLPSTYREAVEEKENDVIVVANAGSGKTHLLVDHYFHLLAQGFSPQSIIAFTFTEKAASELKGRILQALPKHPEFEQLEPSILDLWKKQIQSGNIGTIHQFCLRVLQESTDPDSPHPIKIIDEATEVTLREQTISEILKQGFQEKNPHTELLLKSYGMPALLRIIRQYLLNYGKIHSYPTPELPSEQPLETQLLRSLNEIGKKITQAIEKRKNLEHWHSFDDLETKALTALKKPSKPLQGFLNPIRHILVDEFQDTSPIQITLLEALRPDRSTSNQRKILFCVGDPKQSIYRFRNVDRRLVEETEKRILDAGGRRFDFIQNFRSTPRILEIINLYSKGAFPDALPSLAIREPLKESVVERVQLGNPEEKLTSEAYRELEARWVTQKILDLKKENYPLEKITVLFRASASALILMDHLKNFDLPFTVRGGRELLKRQEILDLKNLTFFLNNPRDNLALMGVLRSPLFLISDASLFYLTQNFDGKSSLFEHLCQDKFSENFQNVRPEEINKLKWSLDILKELLDQTHHLGAYAILRSFVERFEVGDLYQNISGDWDGYLAIEQFLAWLQEIERELPHPTLDKISILLKQLKRTPVQKAPLGDLLVEPGSIQLLTIHAAKGLQFETVFLIDLGRSQPPTEAWVQNLGNEWGLKLPDGTGEFVESPRFEALKQFHKSEVEEENKRLLYVALTRAEDRLFIPLNPNSAKKNSLQYLFQDCLSNAESEGVPVLKTLPQLDTPVHRRGQTPETNDSERILRPLPNTTPWTNVSELETLAACPLKHHYSYRAKISEEKWDTSLQASKSTLGTLLHQALNLLHQNSERKPSEILTHLLSTQPLWNQETAVADLSNHLDDYLNSAHYQKISQALEDYSELPFLLQLKNGQIRGQIDRLIRDASGWCLIDFKYITGPTTRNQIWKSYAFQLKTYALAAEKFLKNPIHSVEIHLLAGGAAFSFSISPTELGEQQTLLENLLSKYENFPLETVVKNPACNRCPYRHPVPICPVPKGESFRH